MKKTLFLLSILLFFAIPSYSQPLFRNYTSLAYNQKLLKKDEQAAKAIRKMEKQIARHIRFGKFELRTIPVVVHILYANEKEKLLPEQVEAQIEALNSHFSLAEKIEKHPNDPDGRYAKRAADTQIRFCLATQNESGKPIDGIDYVRTNITQWKDLDEIKKNKAGAKPANQTKFLNIWVAHLPDDNAGFAQMPGRKTSSDGIVIDYRYFGFTDSRQYGGAKTLTFLIAQFFGLYPLSGHTLGIPCSDDFVADTPRSNSRNTGCPSYNHVSVCDTRYVTEMTMNFMSGTDDDCRYMFTLKQAARMQAVLDTAGIRGKLARWSVNHCDDLLPNPTANSRNHESEIIATADLLVYPNPANNQLVIEMRNIISKTTTTIEILTIDGKLVFSKMVKPSENTLKEIINVRTFPAGFYLVKVKNSQGSFAQKITIE